VAGGAHYWIDGYNVILRLGLGEGKSLEERRGELIGRVGALGSEAWIAFDSREAVHGRGLALPRRVTVAFATSGRTADDLILAKVSHAKDLNGVIVVSDDRGVADRCQFMGARTMGVREFGKMLKPAPAPGSKGDRKLTPNEVDDWMKWFKEKK
jgi:predicted RNA-binding protein with PIN domain